MRVDIHGKPQQIRLDAAGGQFLDFRSLGGQFFTEIVSLPPGRYAARVQIVFSEAAAGETITLTARALSDGATLDRLTLNASNENGSGADDLYLQFALSRAQDVEISGHAEAHCSTTLLRYLTIIDADGGTLDAEAFSFIDAVKPAISDLNCVIFGTTAVCNASCLHCPTNKDYRKDFPHGHMNFDLFASIIEQLAAGGYKGWFLFGLFGEPLEDPFFERRLRLIKQHLPQARISVATNCGVYDPNKHAFVVDLADMIGVHVEAITPEIYNRFMHPLKADRVFPRIVSLLGIDKANKVHITTPVHKGNLSEVPNIRRYFEAFGAAEAHFTQIGNRSWEKGPWSALSLAPVGNWCHPDELRTFVVDWDGAVLACCLDFSKSAQLGDLTRQTIDEVLNGPAWLEMFDIHRTKSWAKKPACSRCRGDHPVVVEQLVQSMCAGNDRLQQIAPRAFHLCPGVMRSDDGGEIQIGESVEDGVVIYGPYRRINTGHYRVTHQLDIAKIAGEGAFIEIDVLVDGIRRTAVRRYPVKASGAMALDLEFESSGAVTEFRVGKIGVAFVHKGALVTRL